MICIAKVVGVAKLAYGSSSRASRHTRSRRAGDTGLVVTLDAFK
jgi:hypothetical protein